MAITKQPTEDSLFSAYTPIIVETDASTAAINAVTQNFNDPDMVSVNIIDNNEQEILDNSMGTHQVWYKGYVVPRKMVPGEWYALRIDSASSNEASKFGVALFQTDGQEIFDYRAGYAELAVGSNIRWRIQVPPTTNVVLPYTALVVYAGIPGQTAGVKLQLNKMVFAYGQNYPYEFRFSPRYAANFASNALNLYRDAGFGGAKKYDLSFMVKAGFRARPTYYPYAYPNNNVGVDYNLVAAYAYRVANTGNYNVRYASRGVRPRGHNVNFSESNIGLVLTDRTPDSDRNLYVKKYYGYPYFVTLFPKGVSGLTPATPIDVRVKITGASAETQCDISSRLNIPLVYEFDDEVSNGADYVKLRPSGGVYPGEAWNIIFVDTEVPCNPFYIRWINRKGGWDTYMFEQHKKYTQEVDRGDQYVLANARDPYTSETRGELAPEFKNIVQAGAEQLDENDFNLLKGIALSPLVQVYNYQIATWQRVLVNDTDLTWDTKTPRNTVSYEFQLIDEQTQW